MNWAVGITTAPRPTTTLSGTLASLDRAGFSNPKIFDDTDGIGAWRNWLSAVETLLHERPHADVLLICQDDIVCCRRLWEYLDRTLWDDDSVALWSPYSPEPYRQDQPGWRQQRRGWHLVGALCWAMPRHAAEAVLQDLGDIQARRRIDARVGRWAAETNRTVWYHTPSLVQHVGNGNSALGIEEDIGLRRAVDFIGEDQGAGARGQGPEKRGGHFSDHLNP